MHRRDVIVLRRHPCSSSPLTPLRSLTGRKWTLQRQLRLTSVQHMKMVWPIFQHLPSSQYVRELSSQVVHNTREAAHRPGPPPFLVKLLRKAMRNAQG